MARTKDYSPLEEVLRDSIRVQGRMMDNLQDAVNMSPRNSEVTDAVDNIVLHMQAMKDMMDKFRYVLLEMM